MACLELIRRRQKAFDIRYGGVRVWTKRGDRDFYETFLGNLSKSGGMPAFRARADDVYGRLDGETLLFLRDNDFGLHFFDSNGKMLPKNTDLFDQNGTVIARAEPEELITFVQAHRRSPELKRTIMEQLVDEKYISSQNRYYPPSTEDIFGVHVPASERGLCPDFNHEHLIEFIYANDLRNAQIRIPMSGVHSTDLQRAVAQVDINRRGGSLTDYVLHHLDDIAFDDDGVATCTAQIVKRTLHKQLFLHTPDQYIRSGYHVGSVRLWYDYYGIWYQ